MTLEFALRTQRERFAIVVEEIGVALVIEQVDVALLTELRDPHEFFVVDDGAAWIVGRVGDDQPRFRRDGLFQHRGSQSEPSSSLV